MVGSSIRPASAAIAYVQGSGQHPPSGSAVSVTYKSAQRAGDINVVSVAWDDITSTVASIVDTQGNSYVPAGTPGRISGTVTQQFYYAANIVAAAAGTNTVTVTYSKSVAYPEVKVAEYSGISATDPFDGVVSATGTGTSISSGALTMTNAYDLLVASDVVYGNSTAADPNYTSRYVIEGDLYEDRIVTSTGTYTSGYTQSPSSWWLMQLAAFRGAVNHTSVDMVVEEALAPFSSWVNVKTAYGATGNGTTDDTTAIQNCLNYVNGGTSTQEVCYFPAGTYKITATLTNTAGPTGIPASLIGADPATTKILWAGSASCPNTPGLTPTTIGCAMLIQNSGIGADYERLTWDGAGIAQYGVAEWYNHANSASSISAAQHQDEVFENLAIGIQPGRMDANCTDYCDNDSEGQVRRVSFINDTYAGLDTGSFNAVDWWIWDSSFSNCARGVSNDYEVPGGYVGTNGEGAGTAHVYRSNFSNSSVADIDVGHISGWLGVHNNFSTGSTLFMQVDYAGENDAAVIAENNRVVNLSSATPINFGDAGPLMLVDNQFGNTANAPVYAFSPGPPDADFLTLGNTAYGTWPSAAAPATTQRIKSVNDSSNVATGSISPTAPTLPATPAVVSHTVFEVQPTDTTATIQSYINSAVANSDPQAIVHFGGRNTYNISSTLTIPANSNVQLVGDGWMSLLAWTGTNGAGPIISIAGPSKVTIRELQFHGTNLSEVTTPIAITGADSIGGRIQIVGSFLTGVSAANLTNTQLSLQANSGIDPQGLSTASPALTLSGVSSAISVSGDQGSLVMSGNSNYIMEDTWFEGIGSSTSMFNIPNGQFTYVGGNVSPATDGQQIQTVPPVLVNGGSASQTYIGMVFNLTNVNDVTYGNGTNQVAADVENESASTRAYYYGNVTSLSGENDWFSRPGPDDGEVSFVSNRQSSGSSTGQYVNQGDTSNAGILRGWAQARALQWDTVPYTPPAGATDIRIYRVFGVAAGGVTITN